MLKVPYGRYVHNISDWSPANNGETMMCRNHVYLDEQEICVVPGVITFKEWNMGNIDPKIQEQLFRNLIELGEFVADEKLGFSKC